METPAGQEQASKIQEGLQSRLNDVVMSERRLFRGLFRWCLPFLLAARTEALTRSSLAVAYGTAYMVPYRIVA